MVFNFTGCTEQSPMAASENKNNILQTSNGPVQVLHLGDLGVSLEKVTSITEFIRADEGGLLYLQHNKIRSK